MQTASLCSSVIDLRLVQGVTVEEEQFPQRTLLFQHFRRLEEDRRGPLVAGRQF